MFDQKSETNMFVSSVSYHIYSCESTQYIAKVSYCNGMKDNFYGLILLKKYNTGILFAIKTNVG